jgi:hypothetical protein
MMQHLDHADLVELSLVDENDDRTEHLKSCRDCLAAMKLVAAELEADRSAVDSEVASMPATFWQRQELSITREVAKQRRRRYTIRYAAAAVFAVVAASGAFFMQPETVVVAPVQQQVTLPANEALVASESDPWESDQLSDYSSLVDWESWDEETTKRKES